MEILFLTTVLPGARTTGGEVASQAVVDALRGAGHAVTVVGYRRPADSPPREPADVDVGRRAIETDEAGWGRPAVWMLSALARGLPYSAAKYRSGGYLRAARSLLRRGRFQLAVVDHAQVGWVEPELRRARLPFVTLAHNVEQQLYAGQADESRGARRRLHRREADCVKRLEDGLARSGLAVWALTEADAAYFREFGPARTLAIPSGLRASMDREDKRCDVALLGTWTWDVTRAALEWFLDRVYPRLPDRLAVEVAGRGGGWIEGAHPRVCYRGFVRDALAFLRSARVVAVPSLGGTGVQVKTLDAIASGAQVVVSPAAVRGLGSPPGSVHVADAPEEFARELERLAGSPESLGPSREGIEWTRARRERFESELEAAVAAAVQS